MPVDAGHTVHSTQAAGAAREITPDKPPQKEDRKRLPLSVQIVHLGQWNSTVWKPAHQVHITSAPSVLSSFDFDLFLSASQRLGGKNVSALSPILARGSMASLMNCAH